LKSDGAIPHPMRYFWAGRPDSAIINGEMGGAVGVALGLVGTALLLTLVVAVLWAFAAGVLWIAGRLLPLSGRGRRRD
jgi:hypothetical protein